MIGGCKGKDRNPKYTKRPKKLGKGRLAEIYGSQDATIPTYTGHEDIWQY